MRSYPKSQNLIGKPPCHLLTFAQECCIYPKFAFLWLPKNGAMPIFFQNYLDHHAWMISNATLLLAETKILVSNT